MIYRDIADKISHIQGYMSSELQRSYMFELGKTTVLAAEIGSWKGLSAAIVGCGMLNGQHGKYYCIDTFESTNEELDGESTWDIFNQVVQDFDLQDIIMPLKGYSYEHKILSQVPNNLDFIYIDGNHETPSVLQDTILYVPKLKPEGLVLYHDHPWGTVQDAIKQAMELNLIVFVDTFDDFGIYAKNKG